MKFVILVLNFILLFGLNADTDNSLNKEKTRNSDISSKFDEYGEKFKNSGMGKQLTKAKTTISNMWRKISDKASDTFVENREDNMTGEFIKLKLEALTAAQNAKDKLQSLIRSMKNLSLREYEARITLYEESVQYFGSLISHLSNNVSTISEAKNLQKLANYDVNNIVNILESDDLIHLIVEDTRTAYKNLCDGIKHMEDQAKKVRKTN